MRRENYGQPCGAARFAFVPPGVWAGCWPGWRRARPGAAGGTSPRATTRPRGPAAVSRKSWSRPATVRCVIAVCLRPWNVNGMCSASSRKVRLGEDRQGGSSAREVLRIRFPGVRAQVASPARWASPRMTVLVASQRCAIEGPFGQSQGVRRLLRGTECAPSERSRSLHRSSPARPARHRRSTPRARVSPQANPLRRRVACRSVRSPVARAARCPGPSSTTTRS